MSIHARLSPDAQATLDTQKRNSTISSIIIALLLCTLIGIILGVIAMVTDSQNKEEIHAYSSASDTPTKPQRPELSSQVLKKPSSPTTSLSKVLAVQTPAPIAVAVPDVQVTEPSLSYGDGDALGLGWGDGNGNGLDGGGPGLAISGGLKQRCSAQDRLQRLTKEGGKPEYEDAVLKSLRWLQKNQADDGSWKAQNKPVAMTGLALLAYLGHCETPLSAEFGETVQDAIIYLVNVSNKNEGKLGTSPNTDKQWCYEHAIATYALAEAYTLCSEFSISIPGLPEAVMTAGDHIIANQHTSGGWDYAYDTSGPRGGDSSIVCWHLQALKACKLTELLNADKITKSAKKGIKYLESCELKEKGTIGYTPGRTLGHGPTMTPAAALCLQQWGYAKRSIAKNGIRWMSKNNHFDYKKDANLYMHYYASQTIINDGGKNWAAYNTTTMTHLAENQNTDGSWSIPTGAGHGMSSSHYATCLSTLMMEVYYRFLPSS